MFLQQHVARQIFNFLSLIVKKKYCPLNLSPYRQIDILLLVYEDILLIFFYKVYI